MSDPHSTIPEYAKPAIWRRYEDWRMARYERSVAKNANRYPRLRNQKSFRRLVLALAFTHVLVLVSAIIAFFSSLLFLPPFFLGLAGSLAVLTVVRIVTGSVADAPQGALDEIQLAQRNSARSIGYFAIFSLAFIPYFVLIFMGSAMDYVKGQNVYGIGVLLIAVVYIGACVPTMLTSWWMADPDPEDYAQNTEALEPAGHEAGRPTHDEPPVSSQSVSHTDRDLDPPAPAPW